MTRIDFHSNASNRIDYVCRLVKKAYASGHRVVLVTEDDPAAAALDAALWNHQPSDFVPHCFCGEEDAALTPVVIATGADEPPHHEVLINLSRTTPQFFSRFERLIEVIAGEDEAVAAGRARWSFYRDRGYALTHHDARGRP